MISFQTRGGRRSARVAAMLIAVVSAQCLAACGGSDEDAGDSGGLTAMTIAAPPTTSFTPIALGIEQGFFEEEGIDLELNNEIANLSIVPSVAAGQLDAGATVWGGLIPAVAQNVPLTGIAGISVGGATAEEDDAHLLSLRDSGITSPEDLAGKKIAVPNIASISAVEVRAVAELGNLGPEDYTLVQVDIPNMAASLRSGQVDVIYASEPTLTSLESADEVNVIPGGTHHAVMESMPFSLVVVGAQWAEENPDLVEAFQRAMQKSTDFANENPDELRALLPEATGLDEQLAQSVMLPPYDAAFDLAKVQDLADIMVEQEIIENEVTMTDHAIPLS